MQVVGCLIMACFTPTLISATTGASVQPIDTDVSVVPVGTSRVRAVAKAHISYPTGDKSFGVLEAFPSSQVPYEATSPFLLAHEFGKSTVPLGESCADPGPPKETGKPHVGWHPHRGFDIVSYIKEGRGQHADSMGNVAVVRPGGVQWMRTGSGIEHAEGGGNPKAANMHGFQLWINLPAKLKMSDPAYGTVQPEHIPETRYPSGVLTRSLAGLGAAALPDRTDFSIVDVQLPVGASHALAVPPGFTHITVYAYRGVGSAAGTTLRLAQTGVVELLPPPGVAKDAAATAAVLASHNLNLEAIGKEGFGAIVFLGRPLNEPVSWRGPLVMNTAAEIALAYQELRSGKFLKRRVPYDYRTEARTLAVPQQHSKQDALPAAGKTEL